VIGPPGDRGDQVRSGLPGHPRSPLRLGYPSRPGGQINTARTWRSRRARRGAAL